MKKLLLSLFIFISCSNIAYSETVLLFFWGDGCPHCANAKPFLQELSSKYPSLKVQSYEVYKNKDNLKTFKEVCTNYNSKPTAVPAFFVGNYKPVFGFSDKIKTKITKMVTNCSSKKCINPLNKKNVDE
ncbi:MAG: hypothetical protein BWY78_01357 [Alphaproteobacteria bacterium ADurb.Bin438]|nr:MAG: hypothetical protein BWY78_01357 [Alphaproteobacteria bacterium ADurb.Bin438]